MSKFFVIDETINSIGNDAAEEITSKTSQALSDKAKSREDGNNRILFDQDSLAFVHGRVIIKINVESKNYHTFGDGTVIRRERQFNEMNRRITEPVNAYVISAENIPTGSEVLIGHNSLHDSNKVFDYKNESECGDIRYFSIPEGEVFAWRDNKGVLQPTKGFAFALRVFEPYNGVIEGILPKHIKDVLYITTGELKDNIVHTLKSSDYEIIYQGTSGKEEHLIRCRHYENEVNDREEVMAISHDMTSKLKKGKLLIGIEEKDAKKISNDK